MGLVQGWRAGPAVGFVEEWNSCRLLWELQPKNIGLRHKVHASISVEVAEKIVAIPVVKAEAAITIAISQAKLYAAL